MRIHLLLFMFVTAAGSLEAQSPARPTRHWLGAALGVTNLKDQGTGMSVTGSWLIRARWLGLNIVPLDVVVLPQPANSRYRRETFDNGSTVCRDIENGQFAADENCTAELAYGAAAEGGVTIPLGERRALGLWGGYRAGETAGPYFAPIITFGPARAPHWQLRGRVGATITEVSVSGYVPLGR